MKKYSFAIYFKDGSKKGISKKYNEETLTEALNNLVELLKKWGILNLVVEIKAIDKNGQKTAHYSINTN